MFYEAQIQVYFRTLFFPIIDFELHRSSPKSSRNLPRFTRKNLHSRVKDFRATIR